MISFERMQARVFSCLAQRGGKATKAEIIQNAKGKKVRLIQTIDHLVDRGKILQQGKGTKGDPHIFTLLNLQHEESVKNQNQYITVTI